MIVWLSSYPASGANLVRSLLEQCFQLKVVSAYEGQGPTRPEEELACASGRIKAGKEWETFYRAAVEDDAFVPLLTHEKDIDRSKAIYVVRDPTDVIADHYQYAAEIYEDAYSLQDLILGLSPAGGWLDHVNNWCPWERTDTLLLKAEDLFVNPSKSISAIGGFLDLQPVLPENWRDEESGYGFFLKDAERNPSIGDADRALISTLYEEQMKKLGYAPGEKLGAAGLYRAFQATAQEKHAVRANLKETKEFVQELVLEKESRQQYVSRLENALEPRLSSILKLRPLRYALSERNHIKRSMAQGRPAALTGAPESVNSPHTQKHGSETENIISRVNAEVAARKIKPVITTADDTGIAVFTHDRAVNAATVLKALELQGALPLTHVWIDGDHGNPSKRARVDLVQDCVSHFDVKKIHRNRGNFGFRKMMLLSMRYMMERYEKIIFLEDDCFPTQAAVKEFNRALTQIENVDSVFSVYGHPFMIPGEEKGTGRFQGWGWATTAEKLRKIWPSLMECYLQTEEEYLDFVEEKLSADIAAMIDVTPGRQPTDTLRKFFAWDETLCLLTALQGMRHQKTEMRLIYNFGAGSGAAHFHQVDHYRKPPFNMISLDEVWDNY